MKSLSVIAGKSRFSGNLVSQLKIAGYSRVQLHYDCLDFVNHHNRSPYDLVLLILDRNNKQISRTVEFLKIKSTIPYVFCIKNPKNRIVLNLTEYQPRHVIYEPFTDEILSNIIQKTGNLEAIMKQQSIEISEVTERNAPDLNGNYVNGQLKNNYAFFKSGIEIIKVFFSEILYIQSDHVYVYLITTNKKIPLRAKLEGIENYLPAMLFQRVHQRYIVNIDHISRLNSDAVFLENIELPLSKKYKKTLVKHMNVFT